MNKKNYKQDFKDKKVFEKKVFNNKTGNIPTSSTGTDRNVRNSQTYIPEEYKRYYDLQDQRIEKIRNIRLKKEAMHMLPLGGIGEIGMNALLYHYLSRWILVDCGNSFDKLYRNSSHVVIPNMHFIQEHIEDFDGIVLTHGHEDHIGALAYVWDKLQCPIYGTKFTVALVKRKFEERGLPTDQIQEIEVGKWYKIGSFQLKWILAFCKEHSQH